MTCLNIWLNQPVVVWRGGFIDLFLSFQPQRAVQYDTRSQGVRTETKSDSVIYLLPLFTYLNFQID